MRRLLDTLRMFRPVLGRLPAGHLARLWRMLGDERTHRFGGQVRIDSFFPPWPSPAFDRLCAALVARRRVPQAAGPDVIIFLTQGDDMVNALKQAVQFGLDKKFHLAGAQQELEALEGLPTEAREVDSEDTEESGPAFLDVLELVVPIVGAREPTVHDANSTRAS